MVAAYERDAIRPRIGHVPRLARGHGEQRRNDVLPGQLAEQHKSTPSRRYGPSASGSAPFWGGHLSGQQKPRGLNEDYARELMELHTLGVDGA
jgi:hypothetical protein